ncbi:MAG: DUF4129 domain-containing protein, partial [Acidobacteria bacterium]|nr:DUF4129 domain-containing protein [Acidobacteriota bacterium]
WRYYTGAVPLILCFIPMWVANGQIRTSEGALLTEAVLLSAAYLLRVCMVSSYMQRIRARAFNMSPSRPRGASAQAAALGRLLAWKIFLSAAAFTALPSVAGATWLYSASQFASLEAPEDGAERHSLGGCLALANQWFGGGLLLFLMLLPLWIAVWLNGLLLAMLLPQLFHSIFGVNTLLSTQMGIYALVQSSAFWLSLLAVAGLAIDPVVKCTFAIVYQHLRSWREGDDLRGLLASLPREQLKKAQMISSKPILRKAITAGLFVLATTLLSLCPMACARAASVPSTSVTLGNSSRAARIQTLRQALDQESKRAIYRWHDAEHPSPATWFDKFLVKIEQKIDRAWNAFWNFLRRLLPRGLRLPVENQRHASWQLKDLRLWLTLVALLTFAAGGVFFWLRRRPNPARLSMSPPIAPLPELNEGTAASERSEDEWFALASRLECQGQLRFALRAAYFGLLAGLARREWLTIRQDRTNREYLTEFTRRWRRRPQAAVEVRAEIPEKLRGSLRQFDSVWYGSHALTPEAVATYCQHQREFLSHV